MRVINLSFNAMICQPIKRVFDFISTPQNDVQWQYGILASYQTSMGSMNAGSLFGSFGHFLGRRIQSNYEITEYEPNRKYGFKSIFGPIELQTLYDFEIAEGCTQVDVFTHLTQNGFFKLPDALLAKLAKRQFKENLVALKSLLEA
jgi:hypothetical protein